MKYTSDEYLLPPYTADTWQPCGPGSAFLNVWDAPLAELVRLPLFGVASVHKTLVARLS